MALLVPRASLAAESTHLTDSPLVVFVSYARAVERPTEPTSQKHLSSIVALTGPKTSAVSEMITQDSVEDSTLQPHALQLPGEVPSPAAYSRLPLLVITVE